MRRFLLLTVGFLLAIAFAIPAGAHDGHQDWQPDGSGGLASYGGEPALDDTLAVGTMTDTLTAALYGPCENDQGGCDTSTVNRQCTQFAINDRSSGPAPADASEWQGIYFIPSNGTVQRWSRPVGCNDGQRTESNIGYGLHNTRSWMSSRDGGNATRIRGQSFRVLTRNYSAYSRTWTFYDVMFFRAPAGHDANYFHTSTFQRIIQDLDLRGFNQVHVKYAIWADVRNDAGFGGQAEYNGNQGAQFRQALVRNPITQALETKSFQWGCANSGDTAMMQEALHMWGTVNPTSADHDGAHQYHATQQQDVMFWRGDSTLSGVDDQGHPALGGQSVWDAGAQTYTDRVLSFPAYLKAFSTAGSLHLC
ncbi:MAG: hypothetical protein ABR548_01520 [Actinomycetota bacterium]|nr:hypothetical protein [Actinomycetota bacterium]